MKSRVYIGIYLLWLTIESATSLKIKHLQLSQRQVLNEREGFSVKEMLRDLETVLEKIPIEERKNFVKYNFAQALIQKSRMKPQLLASRLSEDILSKQCEAYEEQHPEYKMKPEVSLKILEVAEAQYELDDEAISDYTVFNIICFPSGCVDPGDIGSVCCPFMIEFD